MEDANSIEQLLIDWEAARERGENLTAEELCKDAPHLLPKVQPQIRALQRMYGMLVQPGSDQHGQPIKLRWPGIPNYEFIAHVGAGGMGVVFKARDNALGRDVAIKTIAGLGIGNGNDDRFRIEAEAVAQLKHPGIVQVYGYGHHQQQPYIVMEYVEGCTLRDKLDGSPIKPRIAAQLIEIIARAIHAAHAKGIIHRDLKPANILLQSNANAGPQSPSAKTIAGDSTVNASEILPKWEDCDVKITDFGIAKRLDDEISATLTGEVIGTPNYMAPEQAAGLPDDVGPHTDIHAIGAILFELLTGHPPFAAPSVLETLQLVKETQPVDPRRLQPGIPVDLATICLKCLEKQTDRRYSNAKDLADDLERFLAGKSISARPTSNAEKAWRWCKRNPVIASLTLALVIALSAGLFGILWGWQQAVRSNQRAEASLEKARVSIDEYFTLVSEETLLDEPGFHDLREQLLNSALTFYEQLIEENNGNSDLLEDLADAHAKVAHISAVVGKLQKSREHYDISFEIYRTLNETLANDDALKIAELKAKGQYATVLYRSGMVEQAQFEVDSVISSCVKYQQSRPDETQLNAILLNAYRLLGALHDDVGDPNSCKTAYEAALVQAKKLVAAKPNDSNHRLSFAQTYKSLGQLSFRLGEWGIALTHYENALAETDKASEDASNQLSFAYSKANVLNDIGNLMVSKGNFDRAIECYADADSLVSDLTRLNPKVLEYKNLRGVLLHNLGHASIQKGEFDESNSYLQQALVLRKSLIEKHHQSHSIDSDYANTLNSLAVVSTETGDLKTAVEYYQKAINVLERLNEKFPEISDYKLRLAMVLGNINTTHLRLGTTRGLVDSQLNAVALTEELLKEQGQAPTYFHINLSAKLVLAQIFFTQGLSTKAEEVISSFTSNQATQAPAYVDSININHKFVVSLSELSELQYQTGKLNDAIKTIKIAIDVAHKNSESFPQSNLCRHALSKCFLQLAKLQINSNKLDDASSNLEKALTINSELTLQTKKSVSYQLTKARIFFVRAQLHARKKSIKQSIEDSLKCIEISKELVKQSPGRIQFRQLIAETETNLGNTLHSNGDDNRALEYLQSAANRWETLSKKYPQSDEAQVYHAVCLLNFGNVIRNQSDFEEAAAVYTKAIELAQTVLEKRPNDRKAKTCLAFASWGRARTNNFLQQYALAADDWQRALDNGHERYDLLFRMEKAWSLSKSGQHQQAFAEANDVAKRHKSGNGLFIAARLTGQAVNALENEEELQDEQKSLLLQTYQDQTMKWLKAAKELNVFESPQIRSVIKTHGDFAGMRRFEPFRSFSAALD